MYLILFSLLCVKSAFSANVLYIASMPSPSHHIWNRALAIGLVDKGHNVTLVDPDVDKNPKPENFTHIVLEGVYDSLHDDEFDINEMGNFGPTEIMYAFQDYCLCACNATLKSKGLKQLLSYPPDFKVDLLIIDVTGGTCLYPLIQTFNYPPTIAVTAFLLPSYVAYNFGNSLHPSYIPWYGLPYTTEMTFAQRLRNHFYTLYDIVSRYTRQYKQERDLVKEVFGEDVPQMEEFERHTSLVFANTDPVLDHPQPLASNFISVGGLHTRKTKNLPQDLLNLLDKAKHGVIVFSLGTNVRSDKLDKRTQKALLEAFGKISETVIWKFESDIDHLPKNVFTMKWLPQNDVLGHPNVKLFIGHGGALSTQESIFHGVPMICIPFVVDQHINTRLIVDKKLGVSLDFKRITSGYVLQKLREVLDNPIYTENMKTISSLFKDRTETPLERAVFWAEYVIRHRGAQFLSSPARDLPFYKVSGLDIIIFLIVTATSFLFILYKVIALVWSSFVKVRKVKVN